MDLSNIPCGMADPFDFAQDDKKRPLCVLLPLNLIPMGRTAVRPVGLARIVTGRTAVRPYR